MTSTTTENVRIEFSGDDSDSTFISICLKPLVEHSAAVNITTTSGDTFALLLDMWHDNYRLQPVVSGRAWDEEAQDYVGDPMFLLVSIIVKVEVL
jgi:hypothetical protein